MTPSHKVPLPPPFPRPRLFLPLTTDSTIEKNPLFFPSLFAPLTLFYLEAVARSAIEKGHFSISLTRRYKMVEKEWKKN